MGNPQAQLQFRDDQQRAFGISNITNFSLFGADQCIPTSVGRTTDFKSIVHSFGSKVIKGSAG